MRHELLDLTGEGDRRCRVWDMPVANDYWAAVTDVACPSGCGGQVRWAEAGYVAGYQSYVHNHHGCRCHGMHLTGWMLPREVVVPEKARTTGVVMHNNGRCDLVELLYRRGPALVVARDLGDRWAQPAKVPQAARVAFVVIEHPTGDCLADHEDPRT